jgi:catechol 2,3-dioxygenase-like lactoylglutathione lyase family enzyme
MALANLIPMLPVTDIHKSIAFYEDALGFAVSDRQVDENGHWSWCSLKSGPVELMLALRGQDIDRAYQRQARGAIVFYFYPDDVAALHAALKQKGHAVSELRVTSYRMKEFELKDPDGHSLWFGQEGR